VARNKLHLLEKVDGHIILGSQSGYNNGYKPSQHVFQHNIHFSCIISVYGYEYGNEWTFSKGHRKDTLVVQKDNHSII
jgi:hypothetical protein